MGTPCRPPLWGSQIPQSVVLRPMPCHRLRCVTRRHRRNRRFSHCPSRLGQCPLLGSPPSGIEWESDAGLPPLPPPWLQMRQVRVLVRRGASSGDVGWLISPGCASLTHGVSVRMEGGASTCTTIRTKSAGVPPDVALSSLRGSPVVRPPLGQHSCPPTAVSIVHRWLAGLPHSPHLHFACGIRLALVPVCKT